ncbi:type II toxin-antitoxin system RelE/ParE family toxin [Flavobacterium ginsenosidimutans]|uniref:type II toxin-antitoxin system RelE/ParE family toxin n=1 Tax=Flavobacterium ginsenosidimutans TaxID=687844 RepID=UPI003D966C39
MGKKIIWTSNALNQLEDIHFYIFFESKSITIADKVVNTIFESTEILKTQQKSTNWTNRKPTMMIVLEFILFTIIPFLIK